MYQAEGNSFLIKCPICGARTEIIGHKLPEHIKTYVKNKNKGI